MDTRADIMNKGEESSCNYSVEAKNQNNGNADHVPIVANKGTSLAPETPLVLDFKSPLDLASPPPTLARLDDHVCEIDDLDSPRTPKEVVFDPFAPGPDDPILAPQHKKFVLESRISVAKRLNFDSCMKPSNVDDANGLSDDDDEAIIESVYGSLLEVIVSTQQTENFVSESSSDGFKTPISVSKNSSSELGQDGFNTPTSEPRLSWIAETCPNPPMKPMRKVFNIDLGLCRKLEF